MREPLRHLYIGLMVLLFVIAVPVTLSVAFGYRIDRQTGRVVRTGTLLVDTVPRNAVVKIEGRTDTERTPVAIRNLLPGWYGVTIDREGYVSWQKRVQIVAEASTRFENIALVQSDRSIVTRRTFPGLEPLMNPDQSHLAWRTAAGQIGYGALQHDRDDAVWPVTTDRLIGWSPFGRYLLAQAGLNLIVVDRTQPEAVGIVPLPAEFDEVLWNQRTESIAYFLTDGAVSVLDLFSRSLAPLPFTVHDLLADGESLLTIESNGVGTASRSLIERRAPSYERRERSTLPAGSSGFITDRVSPLLTMTGSTLTLTTDGIQTHRTFTDPVRGARWSPRGELLLWTESELWITKQDSQNSLKDDWQLLGRYGAAPTDVHWLSQGSAFIWNTGDQLLHTEADARDQRYQVRLAAAELINGGVALDGGTVLMVQSTEGSITVRSLAAFAGAAGR